MAAIRSAMNKILVWDLSTRFFHWAFALCVTAAFFFATAVGEHSPLFPLHMIFGIAATFLLVLRVVLGVFGSRHSRFVNFPLRPDEAVRYFVGALTGSARRYVGHNPGSALAALAMFILVPLVTYTGIGNGGEAAEDVHGVLAYALLAAIGVHLLGLILHSIRHRENIALSMVNGRKEAEATEVPAREHRLAGVAFAAIATAWIVALIANYDAKASTVRLPVLGTTITLGENEGGESEGGENERGGGDHAGGDHDDD